MSGNSGRCWEFVGNSGRCLEIVDIVGKKWSKSGKTCNLLGNFLCDHALAMLAASQMRSRPIFECAASAAHQH